MIKQKFTITSPAELRSSKTFAFVLVDMAAFPLRS